jgi:lipopolysaccharide export LptBFGC system permease protein LptF
MAAIERGMELPPASLDFGLQQSGRIKSRTALLPGLMWFFVGLAISSASLAANGDAPPMFICLIPVAIGLAYLIYYVAEERKTLPNSALNSTP